MASSFPASQTVCIFVNCLLETILFHIIHFSSARSVHSDTLRAGQIRHFFKGSCAVSQVTQGIMIMGNRASHLQPNKPTKHNPGPRVAGSCWKEALWITGTTKEGCLQQYSFTRAHIFFSSSPALPAHSPNRPALFALIQTPGRCKHVTEGSHEARRSAWGWVSRGTDSKTKGNTSQHIITRSLRPTGLSNWLEL